MATHWTDWYALQDQKRQADQQYQAALRTKPADKNLLEKLVAVASYTKGLPLATLGSWRQPLSGLSQFMQLASTLLLLKRKHKAFALTAYRLPTKRAPPG